MDKFMWENRTRVRSGQGCVKEYLGRFVSEYAEAGRNIMLGYGGGSIKKNGAYDDILSVLTDLGYRLAASMTLSSAFPTLLSNI